MKSRTDFCATCDAEVELQYLYECNICNGYYCDYCKSQGETCECAVFTEKECSECATGIYPYYGVAPHTHDTKNGIVGSTRIIDKKEWKKYAFSEDLDCEGLGVYNCPKCNN